MSDLKKDDFGFKRLSLENWLTPDSAWAGVFMSYSSSNQCEGFVHDICEKHLADTVPLPVRKLFETARGALVYSVVFYPLLTLGAEQLMRVFETAVSMKCERMSAPDIWKFPQKIAWLVKHAAIPKEEEDRWKMVVELRNDASHPKDQKIFDLAMTLTILDLAEDLINPLFAATV
jgi:hypothetical protein